MTSDTSRGKPEGGFLGLLRGAALIAVLAGAAGSFGLMLQAGSRQKSLILIVLFTVWDLSPFVALICAHVVSKRWPVPTRVALYTVMVLLSGVSVAIYGNIDWRPSGTKPAFLFLMVPLASWVLIAIVAIAGFLSGRRSGRGTGG